MFRISLIAGSAILGAAVALAPIADATPADDQFLNDVQYAVKVPMGPITWQLVNGGRSACSILAQGYNSTDAMTYATSGFKNIFSDRIGFMLAATRAYCPQYTYMYAGA
jgi:hypothetical protein